MENKYLYGIIIATVAILIGLAFWSTVGSSVSTLTGTQSVSLAAFTFPANGTSGELTTCGQEVITIAIQNATGGETIAATNYSTTTGTGADGFISSFITINASSEYSTAPVSVNCTYYGKGYVNEGSTRAIVLLIPIFLALIIAFAAIPDLREWMKGMNNK